MQNQHSSRAGGAGAFLRSRAGIALFVFLAIAAFYLVTEHTAHFYGLLPFALLLACLLMHLFMHGGHGGHGSPNDQSAADDHGQHQAPQQKGDPR